MDNPGETTPKFKIDVGEVLKSKNPALAKTIPGFFINYLKKIIHQDDINEILTTFSHLRDAEFIRATLGFMHIEYRVFGRENIPQYGRYFFVSNHPLGGLDGLVFMDELSNHFSDIKFPVNDLLMNLKNISGIFLPINKHGGQAKDAIRQLEETYASDSQILYFPAGLCSRKKRGIIKDLPWHKSFIAKAIQHKRDVVPCFFSGSNSNFFYNLANLRTGLGIKSNFEMLYLPDEMFSQKGKMITLVFGKPFPWETFDRTKTFPEWAEWVKTKSYELESMISG